MSSPLAAVATKARKEQLGHLAEPLVATKLYSRVSDHPFGDENSSKTAVSWIVITPAVEGEDGTPVPATLIRATTYDGNLGKKFNLGSHNQIAAPALDSKEFKKATKGYSEVTPDVELPAFVTIA